MTEQQTHLQSAIQQQNTLLNEIQKLQGEIDNKRQLAVKAQGIIEYLDQIGVKLPEADAEGVGLFQQAKDWFSKLIGGDEAEEPTEASIDVGTAERKYGKHLKTFLPDDTEYNLILKFPFIILILPSIFLISYLCLFNISIIFK